MIGRDRSVLLEGFGCSLRYGESGQLSRKELRRVPLRLWAKAAAEGDDEGPLRLDLNDEFSGQTQSFPLYFNTIAETHPPCYCLQLHQRVQPIFS